MLADKVACHQTQRLSASRLPEVLLSNHQMLYHKHAKDLSVKTAKFCVVKPRANVTTLVLRIDERYQGVSQAETENKERRKK